MPVLRPRHAGTVGKDGSAASGGLDRSQGLVASLYAGFQFDHVHLRSPDPDATARFFETMFDAEVTRGVYPPGTLYPGKMRVTMRWAGRRS